MKLASITLTLFICLVSCQNKTPKHQSEPMDPSEQVLIDQTIKGVFQAICFKAGSPPNMPNIREYFTPEGLLINYNQEEPLVLGVEEFIDHFHSQWQQGHIPSLEDRELVQETHVYGRVAHRFSFYEARFDKNDQEPFARGVNSIQLIKIKDKWLITSMAWNDDNRGYGFFDQIVGDTKK